MNAPSRRHLGVLAGLFAASLSAFSATAPSHIVFIQADDLGWRDLGCYGGEHLRTPAIDALARSGMRFTQAYAGAPVCTPSRACTITGLHCARLRTTGQASYRNEDVSARKFAHPDFRTTFPVGTPTVARTLGSAGYRTVLLGKWGFDDDASTHGFSEVISGPDETLTARAIEVLSRDSSQPLFLYLNYSRPHIPLRPDPKIVERYKRDGAFAARHHNPQYAAVVEELNREVGRVLEVLDRAPWRERTLVVFTSDNGGFLGSDDETVTSNAPLREGKASLYEGGLRVPLIVRAPGVAAGSSCVTAVHGVDWHATLAEFVGVAVPIALDGTSFMSELFGRRRGDARPLFWHFPHYRRARAGIAASPSSAVRDGDWKLIHFYEDDHVELFNLADDPSETRNLARVEIRREGELRKRLDAWRREVSAQPPVPRPATSSSPRSSTANAAGRPVQP